ncbi:hypothetical protein EIP86_009879 [Pleurotus ostreatoroseus]|nr:hypothetical protein EIP86_009879 [Pleurotus ostreatoroseus]
MANFPAPEPRRTFVSSGSFQIKPKEPSDAVKAESAKLDLDVVFPADSPSAGQLQNALSQLTTKYHRMRIELAKFSAVAESHISLRPHTSSETDKRSYILPCNAKVKAALTAWDARLEDSKWEVVYHCAKEIAQLDAQADVHVVQPKFRTSSQLIVPEVSLECPKGEEEREEWDEAVSSVLEWSGMACLESQRLQANDKTDPFIAVYALPTAHRIADVQHFRWTGLLAPVFVQNVLNICRGSSFLSLTANAIVRSPVTYTSPLSPHRSFLRAPREESEDVWTLLLQSSSENDTGRWLLAESIGKFDTRWG